MEKFCFECRENSGISLVLISQGNFRWPFNQSDARIKPNWSLAFSCTLRSLRGELWILIGFLWYFPTIWFAVIIYLTLVKCCTTVIGCIWKPLFCNTAYELSPTLHTSSNYCRKVPFSVNLISTYSAIRHVGQPNAHNSKVATYIDI